MTDYFTFEVFVHALEFADPSFVEATLGLPDSTHFPNIPYAIALNFLDYPLILVYAKHGALDTNSFVDAFPRYYDFISFENGKSCMLQANAEEMQFLVEQTPLYVSLFHIKTLPKPTMLAAGHTPLLISQAPPARTLSDGTPQPTALQSAAVRQITLFSPAGVEVGIVHLSCRLTHFGMRVPPLSTLSILPQQSSAATAARPATTTRPAPDRGSSSAPAAPANSGGKGPGASTAAAPAPAYLHHAWTGTLPPDLIAGASRAAASPAAALGPGLANVGVAVSAQPSQRDVSITVPAAGAGAGAGAGAMSELRRQRHAAVTNAMQPPAPPALFFANDPLMSQQPQAFLQRAQDQAAKQRQAWSAAVAAAEHQARRQQPTAAEVAAAQAAYDAEAAHQAGPLGHGRREAQRSVDETGEEDEEAEPVEQRRQRRRWDQALPNQALLQALFTPPPPPRQREGQEGAVSSRCRAAQERAVARAIEPYIRLLTAREKLKASDGGGGGEGGTAMGRPPKTPSGVAKSRPPSAPAAAPRAAGKIKLAAAAAEEARKKTADTAVAAAAATSSFPRQRVARTPSRVAWAAEEPPSNDVSPSTTLRRVVSHRSPSPRRAGGASPGQIAQYHPNQRTAAMSPAVRSSTGRGATAATISSAAKMTARSASSQSPRRRSASPQRPKHSLSKKITPVLGPTNQQLSFSGRRPSPPRRRRRTWSPGPRQKQGPASHAVQSYEDAAQHSGDGGSGMAAEGLGTTEQGSGRQPSIASEDGDDGPGEGQAKGSVTGSDSGPRRNDGQEPVGPVPDIRAVSAAAVAAAAVAAAAGSDADSEYATAAAVRAASAAAAAAMGDAGGAAAAGVTEFGHSGDGGGGRAGGGAAAAAAGQVYQMSSVLMWEVMSLVTMRTVLSQAISAMGGQMSGMATQVAAQAAAQAMQTIQPFMTPHAAQVAAAAAAPPPGIMPYMTPQMVANMPPGMPIIYPTQQPTPQPQQNQTQPYMPYIPAGGVQTPAAQQPTPQQPFGFTQPYIPGWPGVAAAAAVAGQQTPPSTASMPYTQQYVQQLGVAVAVDGSTTAAGAEGRSGVQTPESRRNDGDVASRHTTRRSSRRSSVSSVPSRERRGFEKLQSFVVRPAPKPPRPVTSSGGGGAAADGDGASKASSASDTEYSEDFLVSEPSSSRNAVPVVPGPQPHRRASDSRTGEVASDEEANAGLEPRSTGGWIKEDKPAAATAAAAAPAASVSRSVDSYSDEFDSIASDEEAGPTAAKRAAVPIGGSSEVEEDKDIVLDLDDDEGTVRPVVDRMAGGLGRTSTVTAATSISGEDSQMRLHQGSAPVGRRTLRSQHSRVAFQVPDGLLREQHSKSTISISEESDELGPLPNKLRPEVTTQEVVAVNPEETADTLLDMDDLLGSTDIRASANSNLSAAPPDKVPGGPQESKEAEYSALFSSDINDDDDDGYGAGRIVRQNPLPPPPQQQQQQQQQQRAKTAPSGGSSSFYSDDTDFLSDSGKRAKEVAKQAAVTAAAKAPSQRAASASSSSLFNSSSSISSNAPSINILGSGSGRPGGGGGTTQRMLLHQSSSSMSGLRRPDSALPAASQRRSGAGRGLMSSMSYSAEGLEIEHSDDASYASDFDDEDLAAEIEIGGPTAGGGGGRAALSGRPQTRYGSGNQSSGRGKIARGGTGTGGVDRWTADEPEKQAGNDSFGETRDLEEAIAAMSSYEDDIEGGGSEAARRGGRGGVAYSSSGYGGGGYGSAYAGGGYAATQGGARGGGGYGYGGYY